MSNKPEETQNYCTISFGHCVQCKKNTIYDRRKFPGIFIFMQFLKKMLPDNRLAHPLYGWRSPLENPRSATTSKWTFGEYLMYFQASLVMATVLEKFALDFDISQHILVVDAHLAMSSDLKTLRTMLGEIKNDIVQVK